MTNDFCFLSVAFGPRYVEQQTRLHQSIQSIHPDVKHFAWTDAYPPGAKPHHESLYGFKVDAISYAQNQGYKKIIWFDTAIVLQRQVNYWFDLNLPLVVAKDDNLLVDTIGEKALKYFGHPNIEGMHLVGGSVYVWNFNHDVTDGIFDDWANAEANGIFGSQHEMSTGQINKHRWDEACLGYIMQANGVQPLMHDAMRYNLDDNSIVRKYHFK